MKSRILGKTGLEVSEIGLGCWQLGNDFGKLSAGRAEDILNTAGECGVTFLDTADVYGAGLSEERIGHWLKNQSTMPTVATKVGRDSALYPDGYTKEKIRMNLIDSAKRLGVDSLDLVQLHCIPTEVLYAGDVLSWMTDFQNEGIIKHIGASVETIDEALFCVEHPSISTIQIIFNIFRQDAAKQVLPKAAENDVGVIVRLPLASGLLTRSVTAERKFEEGDHRNYNQNGEMFHVGETFNGIPLEAGLELAQSVKTLIPPTLSLSQAALRWLLDHPQVSTVIAGASHSTQVVQNAAASNLPELDETTHRDLENFYYQSVRSLIRGGI